MCFPSRSTRVACCVHVAVCADLPLFPKGSISDPQHLRIDTTFVSLYIRESVLASFHETLLVQNRSTFDEYIFIQDNNPPEHVLSN